MRCGLLGGQLVLSNDRQPVVGRHVNLSMGMLAFRHSRVRLAPPHVDSSAGTLRMPLPCCRTMSLRGALNQNPNENATSFIIMDEVVSVDTPRPPGQPPDAALQLDSEVEHTARPSGSERGSTKTKG